MAYIQKSKGLPFKQVGSTPAKQTDSTFIDGSKKTARDRFNDSENPETTDSAVVIAANKKAAEISKHGNKAKEISDYTPAELALIRNPAYQKALSLALDKLMEDNPDTTGE